MIYLMVYIVLWFRFKLYNKFIQIMDRFPVAQKAIKDSGWVWILFTLLRVLLPEYFMNYKLICICFTVGIYYGRTIK